MSNKYIEVISDEYGTTMTTSTTPIECEHNNGWWQRIPWWGIFDKRVFVCEDCNEILDDERKKKIRLL